MTTRADTLEMRCRGPRAHFDLRSIGIQEVEREIIEAESFSDTLLHLLGTATANAGSAQLATALTLTALGSQFAGQNLRGE